MVPFKKSTINTTVPAFGPRIRNVLVVPVLPDPWSRILILKNACPIQRPDGIEPNK